MTTMKIRNAAMGTLLAAVLACSVTMAPAQPAAPKPQPPVAGAKGLPVDMTVLTGAWSRPDGGYTIVIKSIGPDGKLDATYYRPTPLPFEKAQASREGGTVRAFFELRAGGYDGSTYELAYDPATDRLAGTYYQAVARQKYTIYFERK
jgi:uncharacterized protein (DUF2147 family)